MFKLLFWSCLFCSTSAFASQRLEMSQDDSGIFYDLVLLPHLDAQEVEEDGRPYVTHTRQFTTSDGLLLLSCQEKLEGGVRISLGCVVEIDDSVALNEGNLVQSGTASLMRATIGWYGDTAPLSGVFRNSGVCRSTTQTRLFSSAEKRQIELPNGTIIQWPLVAISCKGDSNQKITQLIVDVLPRVQN